jgi:hypothetical protein
MILRRSSSKLSPMSGKLDIRHLAEEAAVHHPDRLRSVAVVVPIKEGAEEAVGDFLAEGPPFDPASLGLVRHRVFVTEREAVFVFESIGGLDSLERILAEPDFWTVLPGWEHVVAGEPRLACPFFDWDEARD